MGDIVILGTGGCAREMQWLLEDNNRHSETDDRWNILGFVEPTAEPGQTVNGLPVLSEAWLFQQHGMNVACGIGEARLRKKVVAKLKEYNPSLVYPVLISRNANVCDRVEMGQGCVVCAGAVVTSNVRLGEFVMVNFASVVAHDANVGDYCQINPSTNISGAAVIGDCVQMGTGVKIIPKITVGDDAVLGAGSVVLKDVPAGCTVFGCPARIIASGDDHGASASVKKEDYHAQGA